MHRQSIIHCLLTVLASLLPLQGQGNPLASADQDYPEAAVCGAIREPMAFWSWSRMAGRAHPARADQFANIHTIQHHTRDGRILKGYHVASSLPDAKARGTVLVAQGNATLADQLLGELQALARAGIESWVFDYRGYGDSQGRARLQAIVGDYLELHRVVTEHAGAPPDLYGISFGGIVLLNVIGRGADYRRAVIDSSPARISGFGCPARFDPAAHFPAEDARILVVAGHLDRVVTIAQTQELLDLADQRGGRALARADFNHPFMDRDRRTHMERQALIRDYLLGESF
jgi:alpha/beta superfamily hydrolase